MHNRNGVIPSTNTVYNLTKRHSQVLKNPQPSNEGLWVLVGALAEWTSPAETDARFGTVRQQSVLMGLTDVNKEFEKDDFDYLDIAVNFDSRQDVPVHFGGCSGGGLWHWRIDVNETASGKTVIKDPILSGVAFYQFPPHDGILRCHGRRSIYHRVIQAL